MKVSDIFYHGIRDSIRTVINKMGTERVDKGLTAFEDGGSNWSSCFFARAYSEYSLHESPEQTLQKLLSLPTPIPIRIVYRTFDGAGAKMTAKELKDFIVAVRDEQRPEEVLELLRSLNPERGEASPIPEGAFSITCG